MRTLAGALPCVERPENGNGRIERTRHIRDRRIEEHRATMPVAVQNSACSQIVAIVTSRLRQRPFGAVTADRAIDQRRIARCQRGVIKPEPRHYAGPEPFDQDIGIDQQAFHRAAPVCGFEIEPAQRFARVEAGIEHRLAICIARAQFAHAVTRRRLDLHHFGAHVRQNLARARTRNVVRKIEHFHARQERTDIAHSAYPSGPSSRISANILVG